MVSNPAYRLIDAREFLQIDFGPDAKAELDRGVIRMMAGGTGAHARVQANIIARLHSLLRGSGCRPYGSDMAVKVDAYSVRYPDVSVFCDKAADPEQDKLKAYDDPVVIVEILSPTTSVYDQSVKLEDYQGMASVQTILFVDPDTELCRVVQRTSAQSWHDHRFAAATDIDLPTLKIILLHSEIFARD